MGTFAFLRGAVRAAMIPVRAEDGKQEGMAEREEVDDQLKLTDTSVIFPPPSDFPSLGNLSQR